MRILTLAAVALCFFVEMATAADGVTSVKSPYTVAETLDRLERLLEEKGMTVFARIDHGAGASRAGLELRPTQLLLFGNPKVGTPLMQCGQTAAIDLPQKALAWEDEQGQVWLSYNAAEYLTARHGITRCGEIPEKIARALEGFAAAATAP